MTIQRRSLTTPTIWFSPPALLNDPFECRPWLTFKGSREQIVQSIARGLRQYNPDLTPDNATAHAVSIFLEGRHRNPNTWEGLRRDFLEILEKRIGLYCLSKNNNSILMWFHYAQNYHGYCLEFEAANYTPVFGASQEVQYCANFPVVDFFTTPKEEQVDLTFLTKFKDWSYEEEWRIIDHESGSGVHDYPPELLRGIIFGLRMPEDNRAIIRAWVKKRGHDVTFYEVEQDNRQFKVVVKEIK